MRQNSTLHCGRPGPKPILLICLPEKDLFRVGGVSGLYMTFTSKPLAAYASSDQVEASETHELPSLFPLSPFIDLNSQHIYKPGELSGDHQNSFTRANLATRLRSVTSVRKLGAYRTISCFRRTRVRDAPQVLSEQTACLQCTDV